MDTIIEQLKQIEGIQDIFKAGEKTLVITLNIETK